MTKANSPRTNSIHSFFERLEEYNKLEENRKEIIQELAHLSKKDDNLLKISKALLNTAIKLKQDIESADNRTNNQEKSKHLLRTYTYSYPCILNYFKYLSDIENKKALLDKEAPSNSKLNQDVFQQLNNEKDILIQSILIVYGWMPRIIRLNPYSANSIPGTTTELNKIIEFFAILRKSNEEEAYNLIDKNNDKILEKIQKLIDNSLTATSKLLHFTRPEEFPIWDSTVCNNLAGTTHKKQTIEGYKQFISDFREFRNAYNKNAAIQCVLNYSKEILGYNISLARLLELTIFLLPTKKQAKTTRLSTNRNPRKQVQ